MQYFSPDFFKFFDELSKNNNKEWFAENREAYEKYVKAPFRQFVEKLTEKLANDLPEINRNSSKAIFRINRDIRFSKDKSPYKLNMAAVFSRTGTKDHFYPGFYIHFGADDILVGGGKYFCTKEEIAKIRQEIFYSHEIFRDILNEKSFQKNFGTLQGEKSKLLQQPYKSFAATEPLIANKQFWYYANLTRKDVTGNNLDTLVYSYFRSAYKMNSFLLQALAG